MSEPATEGKRWHRRDVGAMLLCTFLGLLIAISPHLTMLAARGTLVFVADDDDALYLTNSRAPYYGENTLRDAFCGRWEHVPSLYSWLNFVPAAKLTRTLGLPFLMTGFVWRTLGGSLFGMSLYLVFRRLFPSTRHPTAWALGCTIVCLADPGFLGGRSFVQDIFLVKTLAAGTTLLKKPDSIPQYRVVTPLLNLPLVLFLIACLLPAGRKYLRDGLLAAIVLGLCFWTYFFLWTGSVAALGLLFCGLLARAWLAPELRPALLREAALIAVVVLGGFLIGLPQFYSNFTTFQRSEFKPILERMFKPIHLPAGNPARLWNVRNFWIFGKLAIGALALIRWRIPGLGLLWCFSLTGYALASSAAVTGLEFENYHWSIVYCPASEIMLLLLAVKLFEWLAEKRGLWLKPLWLVPASLLAVALVYRPYEALRAPTSIRFNGLLAEFRPLKKSLEAMPIDSALAGPADTVAAVLYTKAAALYAVPYSWMSFVPDQTVHERHALNGWLQGLDRESYLELAREDRNSDMFPNDVWTPDRVGQQRLAIFDELTNDPAVAADLLRRFRPQFLLVRSSAPPPEHAGPWRVVERTDKWVLWTRQPDGAAGSETP